MLVDLGGRPGCDDMPLKPFLQSLALPERQAERFQPLTAFPKAEDLLVSEHGAVVADDPKLEVHGRRHASGNCWGNDWQTTYIHPPKLSSTHSS